MIFISAVVTPLTFADRSRASIGLASHSTRSGEREGCVAQNTE